MKLNQCLALAAAVIVFTCNVALAVTGPTTFPPTPGEWYSGNWAQVKKYAEDTGIPLLLVKGNTGCAFCKKFDKDVLETKTFDDWRKEKKMIMVSIKDKNTADHSAAEAFANIGISKTTGKRVELGALPCVLIYWKKNGVLLAEERTAGRGYSATSFINWIEKYVDYSPVPPVGVVNMTGSPATGSVIREGDSISFTLARSNIGAGSGPVTATVTATGDTTGMKFNSVATNAISFTWTGAADTVAKTFTLLMDAVPGYQDKRNITFTLTTTPEGAEGVSKTYTMTVLDVLAPVMPTPIARVPAAIALETIKDWTAFDLEWSAAVGWAPSSLNNKLYLCWTGGFGSGEEAIGVTDISADAFDLGMVTTDDAAGDITWWLMATFDDGVGGTATNMSSKTSFSVNELPVFTDALARYDAYKKMHTVITLNIATGATDPIQSFSINKALPSGLKASLVGNAVVISGTPSRVGTTTGVKVTAKNGFGVATSEPFSIVIADLPAAVTGKFNIMAVDPLAYDELLGTSIMSVSSSGKITAKFAMQKGTVSFTSGAWRIAGAGYESTTMTARSGEKLKVGLDNGVITGTLTLVNGRELEVLGRKQLALPAGFDGYYTAALLPDVVTPNNTVVSNAPFGNGYVTFTLNPGSASVRYSGKMADGTKLSGSSFFIVANTTTLAVPVFKALYAKQGACGGVLKIEGNGTRGFNTVRGYADWKNAGKAAYAGADGFSVAAEVWGGFFQQNQNLKQYYVDKSFYFHASPPADTNRFVLACDLECKILSMSGTTLVINDNANTKFSGKPANGLFNGSFYLQARQPNNTFKSVKASFYGVLLRNVEELEMNGNDEVTVGGLGYYLLNDTSVTAPNGKKIPTLKRSYGVGIVSEEDCSDCNL